MTPTGISCEFKISAPYFIAQIINNGISKRLCLIRAQIFGYCNTSRLSTVRRSSPKNIYVLSTNYFTIYCVGSSHYFQSSIENQKWLHCTKKQHCLDKYMNHHFYLLMNYSFLHQDLCNLLLHN